MNAPRALPMVSGPVGLADTNSTFTVRGELAGTWPQASGSARIASTVRASAASLKPQVDESGRRHLGALDRRGRTLGGRVADQLRGEDRRDLQRRLAIRPGELHREVRREVAMLAGRPGARPRSPVVRRRRAARATRRSRSRRPRRARSRRGPGYGARRGSRAREPPSGRLGWGAQWYRCGPVARDPQVRDGPVLVCNDLSDVTRILCGAVGY